MSRTRHTVTPTSQFRLGIDTPMSQSRLRLETLSSQYRLGLGIACLMRHNAFIIGSLSVEYHPKGKVRYGKVELSLSPLTQH